MGSLQKGEKAWVWSLLIIIVLVHVQALQKGELKTRKVWPLNAVQEGVKKDGGLGCVSIDLPRRAVFMPLQAVQKGEKVQKVEDKRRWGALAWYACLSKCRAKRCLRKQTKSEIWVACCSCLRKSREKCEAY